MNDTPTTKERKELKGRADHAYCEYLRLSSLYECCGEDQKMKDGSFGKAELDAHRKAQEWLGKHRSYIDAIALLDQHRPAPTDMETHNNMACVSVQKPAPTDEPYNGPLSGQGVITDEARREMVNDWIETIENYLIEPNEDWWEVLKKDAKEILGVFRALIQSPPKVSVTREWIAEKFLPHRYGGDGYVIEAIAVMLRSLGITVSEAVDSDRPEEGKEEAMTDPKPKAMSPKANDGKAMSAKLNRLIGIWRDNCQRLYRHEGRVCKENCPDYTVCQAALATLEALAGRIR